MQLGEFGVPVNESLDTVVHAPLLSTSTTSDLPGRWREPFDDEPPVPEQPAKKAHDYMYREFDAAQRSFHSQLPSTS